jgi:hypothetical protein
MNNQMRQLVLAENLKAESLEKIKRPFLAGYIGSYASNDELNSGFIGGGSLGYDWTYKGTALSVLHY